MEESSRSLPHACQPQQARTRRPSAEFEVSNLYTFTDIKRSFQWNQDTTQIKGQAKSIYLWNYHRQVVEYAHVHSWRSPLAAVAMKVIARIKSPHNPVATKLLSNNSLQEASRIRILVHRHNPSSRSSRLTISAEHLTPPNPGPRMLSNVSYLYHRFNFDHSGRMNIRTFFFRLINDWLCSSKV